MNLAQNLALFCAQSSKMSIELTPQDFLFEYGGDEEEQPVPDVIVHMGDPPLLVATERNDLEMVTMLLGYVTQWEYQGTKLSVQ